MNNSNAAVSTAAHSLAALATDRQMSCESAGSTNEVAAAAQGCQMAITRFLDRMCLALCA